MENKPTVLIIGGTSGIGASAVLRFSVDHKVIFIGRNIKKGKKISKIKNTIFIKCNISIKQERAMVIKKLSKYNITKIVHCAGIYSTKTNAKYYEDYAAVKFSGLEIILSLQKYLSISHICAISSLFTFLPEPFSPSFEKSINKKLEEKIRQMKDTAISNCVAPGLTDTPLARKAYGKLGYSKILSHAPGSRVIKPEEIAETIYWLSCQNIISGSVIPIDGGFLQSFYRKYNNAKPRK